MMTATPDPAGFDISVDLTAAVEAAARRVYEDTEPTWEDAPPIARHSVSSAVLPAVTAAAPAIQAATLRDVADHIDTCAMDAPEHDRSGIQSATDHLRYLADGFDLANRPETR